MTGLPFLGDAPPHAAALLDDDREEWVSYGQLARLAGEWTTRLGPGPGLTLLVMDNSVAAVAALLGAWAAGRAVAPVGAGLPPDAIARLVATYSPEDIISPSEMRRGLGGPPPHPDLALLLSTSGSTGSPNFAALTLSALTANARAIAEVLGIGPGDVAAGHLPLDYSYGLSVLTSHLAAGARVVLTRRGITERPFWQRLKAMGATHLPGVPAHYHILHRLGFHRLDLPHLRTMTQAGGKLDVTIQETCHAAMAARGGGFFVMYGQTEAAPRMTTLPSQWFAAKKGSVGTALPGGSITVVDERGQPCPAGVEGAVVYRGPNVMMGYVRCRADLALPDRLHGVLATGDRGRLDRDGCLTLTGRQDRMAKIYGWRVNLDEVEDAAGEALHAPVAALQRGDCVLLAHEGEARDQAALRTALVARFALPAHIYALTAVPSLPRGPRGKVDYARLEAMLG